MQRNVSAFCLNPYPCKYLVPQSSNLLHLSKEECSKVYTLLGEQWSYQGNQIGIGL